MRSAPLIVKLTMPSRNGRCRAALYRLRLGKASTLPRFAIWLSKPPNESYDSFYDRFSALDGDFALWGRQMVLGPTPEFCLHTRVQPALGTPSSAIIEIRHSRLFQALADRGKRV